jgi:hypothetical protein
VIGTCGFRREGALWTCPRLNDGSNHRNATRSRIGFRSEYSTDLAARQPLGILRKGDFSDQGLQLATFSAAKS